MSFYNAAPVYIGAKAPQTGQPRNESSYVLAALTHHSNHSFPNGDIILKWICEELCSWCWAPGEYLIGKHTGGFSGDKMPQRAQRRPSVYFFPFHIAAHSSRPPSISKTFSAVIERGEELKEDEWENHFFRPQKLLWKEKCEKGIKHSSVATSKRGCDFRFTLRPLWFRKHFVD